ncbi:DUF6879 family protein [Sphaerisporangium rubeum]|uniref:DUF6879 domain-containing protein n=1 Tax=Sphaerisporangium rubeum TaxID=321317 RepID=A0A7X0ICU9_9ACTN|nr:DUF6879 family protein [Sphaerisporangium rubeum]MBB6472801.1 hypothetical protein [Sphaerisporangium rubeum]
MVSLTGHLDHHVFQQIRQASGTSLPREAYNREFQAAYEGARGVVWKLERAQHFHEPYVPSWVAMVEGEWQRSLRLVEEMRRAFPADYEGFAEFRRIRVVDPPLTPYMQWELHVLAARAEAGERARVVPAFAVRDYEPDRLLPELLILGDDLMYEVLYDHAGRHLGGRRLTDPRVIGPCREALADLYDQGEDLLEYHRREVVPLPPPGRGH